MFLNINDIALKFLEHRERSSWETKKHLETKGFASEEIEETIKYLQDFHYLDDSRYCEAYIPYSLKKGKATYRIKNELRDKGVKDEIIEESISLFITNSSELENALCEAKKIISKAKEPVVDEKLKGKIGRRLAYLGYGSSTIYDVLGKIK